MMSNMLVVVTP